MMKQLLRLSMCVLLVASLAVAQRLPRIASPENYKLAFTPNLEKASFGGEETIRVRLSQPTSQIVLNSADIEIQEATMGGGGSVQKATVSFAKEKETVTLAVEKPLPAGLVTVSIRYTGI